MAFGLTALALYLTGVMVYTVWAAKSEVPWRDQWTFLEDVRRILAHDWGRLWYCYWGARSVAVRVLTLASVEVFGRLNAPSVIFTLAVQAAHVALLVWIAWRLFGGVSRLVFVFAAAIVVAFGFSSLQLENFLWPGNAGYPLAWACATGAFYLLATASEAWVGIVALGVVSTFSVPSGILVWPVLIVQACVLRLPRRMVALLIAVCVLIFGVYFWGYEIGPPMGMGISAAIRHPEQSLPILGMIVAAPLTSVSVGLAKAVGLVALAVALYSLIATLRARPRAVVTVPWALAVFGLLSFLSIVASRISPAFVAEREKLHLLVFPSRYYTFVGFFWCGLLMISIWLVFQSKRQWAQLAVVGSLALVFTVGIAGWDIGEAANWRGFYRELDVAGSALIMHVDDPSNKYLTEVYPDAKVRDDESTWLETGHMALYSERRAHLVGTRVTDIASGLCRGSIESEVSLGNGVFRLGGWVQSMKSGSAPKDLVFADESGMIVGIARSGLRRPDLPGKVSGWQGYARVRSGGSLTAYGVLDAGYCPVSRIKP